jgi:hypothetical protein
MEVHQISQVGPGAPVWVWMIRRGKGRWWPGSVLSINALEPFPSIDTRFECRSARKNGTDGPAFVGISTTRMRYLELRDPNLKGDDRPNFVPSAIFVTPDKAESISGDIALSNTRTAAVDASASATTPPVKKSRPREKAKVSNATQDATVIAIEP